MSVPTFEERFEEGTLGAFDASTGTTFPHVAEQARINGVIPWQGAYTAKFDGSGTGEASSLTENGSFDLAANGEDFIKMLCYFETPGLAAGESVVIFQQLASSTDEGTITVRNNGGTFEIGVTEPTSTSADYADLPIGKWFQLELARVVDAGTEDDGVLTLFIDDTQVATIASLNQGAITSAKVGYVSGSDAGNSLVWYLDHVKIGAERFGGREPRWGRQPFLTDSRHLFFGQGHILNASLYDNGANADAVIKFYDTDQADASDDRLVGQINVAVASETEMLAHEMVFYRGCYAELGGTTPLAQVGLGRVNGYGSEGSIRNYMKKRKARG